MRREPKEPSESTSRSRSNLYSEQRARNRAARRREAEYREPEFEPEYDDGDWVSIDPPQSYREQKEYYKNSLREHRYTQREEEEAYPERKKRRKSPGKQEYPKKNKRKKPGRGRKALAAFVCILLILAVGLGIIWCVPSYRTTVVRAVLKSPIGPPVASLFIRGNYEKYVRDKDFDESGIVIHDGMTVPKGNRTIALFGIDSTSEELANGARSDSILVVNVDSSGNMRMASVFRDTYLMMRKESGTEVITKANAAYAFGGPLAAVNMLNENFDLAITDYIVINFWGMANIIDILGGLRLTVSEAEMNELNEYIYWMSALYGTENIPLETYGESVLLTGDQVTAFCRLRSVNFHSPLDGVTYQFDYGRAARQRYVLTELLAQTREKGMLKLMSLANKLFAANKGDTKFIQSSMTTNELVTLFIMGYDMNLEASEGFPGLEHQFTARLDSGETVVADTLEDNAVLMHQFLYGDYEYVPTPYLVGVADRIRAEVARQIG